MNLLLYRIPHHGGCLEACHYRLSRGSSDTLARYLSSPYSPPSLASRRLDHGMVTMEGIQLYKVHICTSSHYS
jgi:hypothetical protein